jgi:hypothetical protein
VNTSGNVGIGTDSPDYRLHVSGTGSTRALIENTDTNWAAVDIRAGGNQSDYIFFKDDSAERARIQVTNNDEFIILQGNSPEQRFEINSEGRAEFYKYSLKFNGNTQGKHEIRTGGRTGTGTYTLFTNGSSVTQSAGIVEVWGIYGTPSGASYRLYVISGNRSIATAVAHTQTNSVPTPTLAWSGAALQISNSNGSLYYHVRVTLHDIGNGWAATWGNFPGMG